MEKNLIYQGDTIEVMKTLPDKTFDFCFADPPYFMQLEPNKKLYRVEGTEFKGCDDEWDKFPSMQEYINFTRKWLTEVKRLLKDNGTICLISGMQSIYEIGAILHELDFWILNDIIWEKSNPTPNFGGTRLNNSHETLIWAAKSKKSKFSFNYKTGKKLNNDKQMGSIWKFPICSGNERLKDEQGIKIHSTQKPEALLHRIITLFTKPNDLILDPFGGTMTTGVVAKKCGRNYVLIEKDSKYIKYGKKRLDQVEPQIGEIENAIYDIKPLKVSFKEMVKDKYLIIGEKFIHNNGQEAILMNENGQLEYLGKVDSMHQTAATMLNKKIRVNAFDYLNVIRDGQLVSISKIRDDYRKKLRILQTKTKV
ncbi:DNA-methyltransferase [Mycoplasmopsis hyopharyngis]|uniref:DNA-methyltransferase n=1 Tax=Mycoplasmopsis hyopharyngis TaxID=29558 RepID=UPI00387328FB